VPHSMLCDFTESPTKYTVKMALLLSSFYNWKKWDIKKFNIFSNVL
jgi:hypothetical protein